MVVARESGVWVKVVDPNNLLVYTATELKRTVFQWTENPVFFCLDFEENYFIAFLSVPWSVNLLSSLLGYLAVIEK